jgi:hypothetical protein
MGVAFWILPRFRTWAERGDERPAFLASLLLNLGVIVAAVGGVWRRPSPPTPGRG